MNYFDKTEISIADGIFFDIKKNVRTVTTDVNTSQKTYELYSDTINEEPFIFVLFECPFHMAFGHWIYESALFLPYLKQFAGARILVNKNPHRDYKKLFFNLFGIDNIHWLDNVEHPTTEYTNIPTNNICIISRNFTLNDTSLTNTRNPSCLSLYKMLILNFRSQIIDDKFDYVKDIEHLFLPRNSIQNFSANNRQINYEKINELLDRKQYVEYNTSDTLDFNDQIKLISRSKNIYLDWGANCHVNGLFSKGSNIYCINPLVFQLEFPFVKIFYDIIQENNTIILL